MDVKFIEEAVADSSKKTLLSPHQHVEPELHDIDVKFIEEAVADSSEKNLLLDPVTPSHIPPSRAYADTPSQSQAAIKHLRFEDETSLKSSTTDATAETPDIFPLLDDNALTMSKDKDPPKKRQCRSKSKKD
ncbi:hypothetical protein OIU78_001861 [Salix suchowensis]|nr:hypothetical protein OIU78_001861 [Salix suchowensis]